MSGSYTDDNIKLTIVRVIIKPYLKTNFSKTKLLVKILNSLVIPIE